MTVPATARRAGPLLGNGVTTSFPFTFKVFAAADIQVTKTITGIDTTLTLNVDYTVTLNTDQEANPGGAIGFTVAPATGVTLSIIGVLDYSQSVDLPDGGAYRAQQIEDALDRLAIQVQQIQELTGRALAYTPSTGPGFGTLPDVATRANKFLVFNASGVAGVSAGTGADSGLRTDLGGASGGAFINVDGGTLSTFLKDKNARVVDSIAALKLLDKTKFTRALVFGYYAAGDTGGSFFWYDSADTTSADNGFSVIVASDGARWKLTQTARITAKQFGANGDNTTNDYVALNALFSTGLRGYEIPEGRYSFATGLINDYRVVSPLFPAPGSLSARADICGQSMANTILSYTGAGYAINLYGGDNAGAGQGIHSVDLYRNFTIQDKATAKTNSGIYMQNRAWWKIENIFAQYLDTALELQSCFASKVENSYFMFSNYGVKLTSSGVLGGINAVEFDGCQHTANSKAGVLGVAVGSACSWRNSRFESNGTQADLTTGGWVGNVGTSTYSGPLTFDTCYFESNAGLADISVDNTKATRLIVLIKGCIFNRASSTAFTNHNIAITSSGGGPVTVLLEGNAFNSLGTYVANAARPFWTGTASLVEFVDLGGNSYNETTSIVSPFTSGRSQAGAINAAGAVVTAPGTITSAKLSTGVYRITSSIGFGKDASYYRVTAVSNDSGGTTIVRNVVQQNATQFDVSVVNNVFTPTDGAFTFNVMMLGGV